MPILRDLEYARPTRTYIGAPIDELKELGNTLQERYDINRERLGKFSQVLDIVDVRDINKKLVESELSGIKDSIKQITERGNFEDVDLQIDKIVSDFADNKTIRAAVQDKTKFIQWKDNIEAMYKEGKIDFDTYNNTLRHSQNQNNKQIAFNKETGTFDNIFSGYSPAEYQDISKAMFDLAKDWKASAAPFTVKYKDGKGKDIESQVVYDPAGKGFFFAGTTKKVSEDEIASALTNAVMSNPKYMAYVNQNLMFRKNSLLASRPTKEILETDIISDNPADGALYNISKDEFKKQVEDAGYKYDEIIADPEMREAMYETFYRKKAVDGYVNPAAKKEGYVETEMKLYDDKVFLENLKAANDLKLQKNKFAYDLALEEAKSKFEKERATSYIDSQPGTLVGSPYDLEKIPTRVNQIDQTISKLETERQSGQGDYAAISNEIAALKQEKNILESFNKTTKTAFVDTPEGISYLQNEYQKFKDASRKDGKVPESFEFFKQAVLQNTLNIPFKDEPRTWTSFTPSGYPVKNSSSSYRTDAFKNAWNELQRKSVTVATNNIEFGKSSYANVLTGTGDSKGKDASAVDIYNEGLTNSLNNYSKNYLAWTSGGMKSLEELKQDKKYKDKEIEMVGGFYDAPIYGTWYNQAVIKDKKTGQVLDTYSVMPKDQNTAAQNYWDLNMDIWQSRGDNDVIGKRAKQTLAHIAFPDLRTDHLQIELSSVDEDSESGTSVYSSVKSVGNGKVLIGKTFTSIPITNNEGKVIANVPKIIYNARIVKNEVQAGTKLQDNFWDLVDFNKPNKIINPNATLGMQRYGLDDAFLSIEDLKDYLFDEYTKKK